MVKKNSTPPDTSISRYPGMIPRKSKSGLTIPVKALPRLSSTGTRSSGAGSFTHSPQPSFRAHSRSFSSSGSGTNPDSETISPCSPTASRTRRNSSSAASSAARRRSFGSSGRSAKSCLSLSSSSARIAASRCFSRCGSSSGASLNTGSLVSSASPYASAAKRRMPPSTRRSSHCISGSLHAAANSSALPRHGITRMPEALSLSNSSRSKSPSTARFFRRTRTASSSAASAARFSNTADRRFSASSPVSFEAGPAGTSPSSGMNCEQAASRRVSASLRSAVRRVSADWRSANSICMTPRSRNASSAVSLSRAVASSRTFFIGTIINPPPNVYLIWPFPVTRYL